MIKQGAVIGPNVVIPVKTELSKDFVQSTEADEYDSSVKLGEFAYTIQDVDVMYDSDEEEIFESRVKMEPIDRNYADSSCTSSSGDESSRAESPVADDGHSKYFIFSAL